MTCIEQGQAALRAHPRTWLVIGKSAFIGSYPMLHAVALGRVLRSIDEFIRSHASGMGGFPLNVQEETTALGVPCLTVRDNTERPITITEGTNQLVLEPAKIPELVEALAQTRERIVIPFHRR